MTAPIAALPLRPPPDVDQTFPKLTPDQITRVAAGGHMRHVEKGEVLVELGAVIPLFVVVNTGSIEVVQPTENREVTVRVIGPGEFTGEVSMLSGRRSLVTLRVAETGEVIEVERDELIELVQTDAELSEIFVRCLLNVITTRGASTAVAIAGFVLARRTA